VGDLVNSLALAQALQWQKSKPTV